MPRDGRRRGRRPKQLTQEPTLLTAGGGRGLAVGAPGRPPAGAAGASAPAGITDDATGLDDVPTGRTAMNAGVRAAARQIATRLAVRPPRERRALSRGAGPLASLPFRGGADVAREPAQAGRGRVLPVRDHRDVAPAFNQILDA